MNCLTCKHYNRKIKLCSFALLPHFGTGFVKGCWPKDCICIGGRGCDVVKFENMKAFAPPENTNPAASCPYQSKDGKTWYCEYGIRKISSFEGCNTEKWHPLFEGTCACYERAEDAINFVLTLRIVCMKPESYENGWDKIYIGRSEPIREVFQAIGKDIGFKFTKDGYYAANAKRMCVLDLLAIFYGTKCAPIMLQKYSHGRKVLMSLNRQLSYIGFYIDPEGGVITFFPDSMDDAVKTLIKTHYKTFSEKLKKWEHVIPYSTVDRHSSRHKSLCNQATSATKKPPSSTTTPYYP